MSNEWREVPEITEEMVGATELMWFLFLAYVPFTIVATVIGYLVIKDEK